MNKTIEKKLSPFMFPVEERAVYVHDNPHPNIDVADNYKAIVRQDSGELISIMKDTYQLVPNREVILPLLEQLHKLDTKFVIDSSHSYVENSKFRLQFTFPSLTISDGQSEIALCLYLSSSYDGSESVKLTQGLLRRICKNGMVLTVVLNEYLRKHTSGFAFSDLSHQIDSLYNMLPAIKHRIEIMQNSKVTNKLRRTVEDTLGKHVIKYVNQEEKQNKKVSNVYALLNIITYYISHLIEKRLRSKYQLETSKIFEL